MPKRWQCPVCGYVHSDEGPPEFCPVCGAERAKFILLEEEKTLDSGRQDSHPTKTADWYESIVMQAPDAILAADQRGIIRLWNHGAERIFGTPADKAIGQSLDLIIPENLRQRHWEGWGKVMQTGASRYGASELLRVPAIRADGSRFSVEFSLVMLKDATGAVGGVAAILRDVTEQWEREKALKSQLEICRNKARDV